jgi:hypothetical protein
MSVKDCRGRPVEEASMESLHITTYQGTYKDTPVEINEYMGGPDDAIIGVYDLFISISEHALNLS